MESFEDAEKRDFVGTISGIIKIVGIMIFTWSILIFQRGIFGSYYFNSVAKTGDLKAGEMVTLVQTLFSLVVLIILSVIFIKMMKTRFGKENLNKIKFWTFVIIVITIVLFALGVTFSMINSIVKNTGSISMSDKITIFFKTGILNGIMGTELVGILLTISLFSIKVYEKNNGKSIFSIIYTAINSIILIIMYYFISIFMDIYMYQTIAGTENDYIWKFIIEIIKSTDLSKAIFNYFFYVVVLIIVIFTTILVLNVFSDNKKSQLKINNTK